jgi:hypothetical protein
MGKYDCQLKKVIYTPLDISNIDCGTCLSEFFDSFISIRDIFLNEYCLDRYSLSQELPFLKEKIFDRAECEELQYNKSYWNNIIVVGLQKMIVCVKNILSTMLSISFEEIDDKCWELYVTKNLQYGDAWFMNGAFGVFYDLHRKSARLYEISLNCILKSERLSANVSIVDTLIDLVNYCAMLFVVVNSSDVLLFQTIGKNKIEKVNFDNVEI